MSPRCPRGAPPLSALHFRPGGFLLARTVEYKSKRETSPVAAVGRRGARVAGGQQMDPRSEAFLAGMDVVGAPAAALDAQGRLLGWNGSCESLTGLSAVEVLGWAPWEARLVDEPSAPFRAALTAGRPGEVQRVECPCLTRLGERRWLAWSLASVEEVPAGRGGVRVLASATDVTAHRRTEDALRASETRFAGIIALAADAIVSVNEAGRVVVFNRGAEALFGWSCEEVMDQPLQVLLPEEARGERAEQMGAFRTEGTRAPLAGVRREVVGRRRDGTLFPAEAAVSRLETGGGQRLFTVALRDVTERKRAEREQRLMARAGELLGQSLEQSTTLQRLAELLVPELAEGCALWLCGANGVPAPELVMHGDPAQAAALAERVHTEGLPGGEEGPLEAGTPGPGSGDALRLPLQARGGELLGHVVLYGEAVLDGEGAGGPPCAEARGLAEALVARAAAALENARLYRLAQAATSARDEVLGVVAHDLRNPLHALMLSAVALERRLSPGDALLAGILRAARTMDRLVQDLLDTHTMDAGQLAVEPEPLPPALLVYEAVESARPLAVKHTLQGEVPSSLPDVKADRARVLQVFSNLLGNALKFTPAGGRITVGAEVLGDAVCFRVSDSGPGIPAELVPHLFERFWRARRSDRRGAGLGLPIARGLVEAHGGRLWVESEEGAGTTFRFTLPTTAPAPAPGRVAHTG